MGVLNDIKSFLEARRGLPPPQTDGNNIGQRGGRYGETVGYQLTPKPYGLVEEGTQFIVTSPTPGTGIVTTAAVIALVDTSPFLLIYNAWATSDPKPRRIVLDYLKLQCTAPGTAGASLRYAVKRDVARSDRYTSGGSPLVPVSCNGDASEVSKATVYAGAIVAAAAPQSVLLGSGLLRPVIPVVGDTYLLNFGATDPNLGALAPAGAAIANVAAPHPMVAIGPQQWAAIHLWLPSQSAASSYEIELSYFER
jgi:hypothetical protein